MSILVGVPVGDTVNGDVTVGVRVTMQNERQTEATGKGRAFDIQYYKEKEKKMWRK